MALITATARVTLTRAYPHLDTVTDWSAQATIRLLWDRIFDLEERLQVIEGTSTALVAGVNQVDETARDALTRVTLKAAT